MKSKRTVLLSIAVLLLLSTGWAICDNDRETAQRVAELLEIQPGAVVADVGAGDGRWTVELARLVGEKGQVIATEVDDEVMGKLKRKTRSLKNISLVMGDQQKTGLSPACCDAIHLRHVYHHFEDPRAMQADLLQALKPGRLIAVIDFSPDNGLSRSNVPEKRSGHGIRAETLIEEMTSAGFELVRRVNDWEGRSSRYLLLFRRPR